MERIKQLQEARVQAREAGFTLVELAIVLVIIGLIVGGVLVGQDLIKAAEIRATTSDLERYNAAANTFRNKYNGVPGDLLASRAAQFNLTPRDGSAGHGDGNGVVEGCSQASTLLGCETAVFWIDLTDAQLVSDAFTVNTSVADGDAFPAPLADTVDLISGYLPSAPLRDTAFISIYPQGGRNFYTIAAFSQIATTGIQTFSAAGTRALTPSEATQLDDKMDDGRPYTGIVRAIVGWNAGNRTGADYDEGATPATGVCVNEGADAAIQGDEVYNVGDPDWANELNCQLSIRSSF
jgi:prepilin-type N-terminal cleavage/methylation domain-containing protein